MDGYLNELEKNRDNDAKFFELLNNNETKLENCFAKLSTINGASVTDNKKALDNYTGQLLKQGIGSLREKYLKNEEETNKETPSTKIREKSHHKKIEPVIGGIQLRELNDMESSQFQERILKKEKQVSEYKNLWFDSTYKIEKLKDKNNELLEEVSNLKNTLEKYKKEIEDMKNTVKEMSKEKYVEPIKGKTNDFKFKIYPDKIHVRKISGQNVEIVREKPMMLIANPFHGMFYYQDLNGKHKIYDEKNREIFFVEKS